MGHRKDRVWERVSMEIFGPMTLPLTTQEPVDRKYVSVETNSFDRAYVSIKNVPGYKFGNWKEELEDIIFRMRDLSTGRNKIKNLWDKI